MAKESLFVFGLNLKLPLAQVVKILGSSKGQNQENPNLRHQKLPCPRINSIEHLTIEYEHNVHYFRIWFMIHVFNFHFLTNFLSFFSHYALFFLSFICFSLASSPSLFLSPLFFSFLYFYLPLLFPSPSQSFNVLTLIT